MGRPLLFEHPLTPAKRQKRRREKARLRDNRDGLREGGLPPGDPLVTVTKPWLADPELRLLIAQLVQQEMREWRIKPVKLRAGTGQGDVFTEVDDDAAGRT
jgi:hypothetical protein